MKTFAKVTISALTLTLAACSADPTGSANLGATAGIRQGQLAKSGDSVARSTVEIISFPKSGGLIFCSASLIVTNLILTAGHCVSTEGNMYIMFSTESHLDKKEDFLKWARPVDGYVVHPQYKENDAMDAKDSPLPWNDIAVLHFVGTAPAGFTPAQILTDYGLLKENTPVTIAGYGVASDADYISAFEAYKKDYEEKLKTGKIPKDAPPMNNQVEPAGKDTSGLGTLRYTDVPFLGARNASEVLFDQHQGTGACEGDSGGPAFLKVGNDLKLFGVASRGAPRIEGSPCMKVIVYTAVAPHGKFIVEAAKQLMTKASLASPAEYFSSK